MGTHTPVSSPPGGHAHQTRPEEEEQEQPGRVGAFPVNLRPPLSSPGGSLGRNLPGKEGSAEERARSPVGPTWGGPHLLEDCAEELPLCVRLFWELANTCSSPLSPDLAVHLGAARGRTPRPASPRQRPSRVGYEAPAMGPRAQHPGRALSVQRGAGARRWGRVPAGCPPLPCPPPGGTHRALGAEAPHPALRAGLGATQRPQWANPGREAGRGAAPPAAASKRGWLHGTGPFGKERRRPPPPH